MRVLALDHGEARCGVAVSDRTGTLATPLAEVRRPDARPGLRAIVHLAREREVGRVLVGLPLRLSGDDSEQTRRARAFAARLGERLGDTVPVELVDERFTTRIAAARGGEGSEDSRAAAVLLEDWLAARRRGGAEAPVPSSVGNGRR